MAAKRIIFKSESELLSYTEDIRAVNRDFGISIHKPESAKSYLDIFHNIKASIT